ncbi:ABC transporter ATP-binding protein [Alkalihalobacterium chitinilyticum]|uniref:ABC transporter ATP-binding protein n=1 Tax=Alkalihalobacterium chitinilyticum TaxID=2980103 RepID=A0ABT5VJS1_9BACI|nr:ABC transporter ATP-binding protein [Alkalihalobacterium chitinilyticum]MDE5415702.1 ABC transporter ATP-binding protein [Alkalihalobacterium chitinilyticum]
MKEGTVLSVQNVSKVIKNKKIIDAVSFDVYPGEVFGFLGPNGAGKTTSIRMIVGLISISEGDIYIKGNHISKEFEKAIAHTGAIVENPEMYSYLSGIENLRQYARMVDGVGEERIKEVIELVGLTDRIKDKVKTYSLGMRQRLGIAQALLHSPSLLILDEPTNGLDPAGIREIRNYLRRLAHEDGLAVLVSSHLLSEMELMCDRIGIIQDGKMVDIKTVRDFVNEEEKQSYRLEVKPLDRALMVITEKFPQLHCKIENEHLQVIASSEEIPSITRELVEKDIQIYLIERKTTTLEDKFLQVTGGRK